MSAEDGVEAGIAGKPDASSYYFYKFRLYETRSKFYMIGRDKSGTCWRVLKIDRSEPSGLDICEDAKTYSESECKEILKRIDEGNRSTGGLKFVTNCYGIIGFVKFLGPYYMMLITRRRQIGVIYGHAIYAVTKTKMIALPNSTVQCSVAYSKNENRYKKLLCTMDLTKDFFFSYSYQVMRSLQKNITDSQSGQVLYESMFVWNEFLTRGIRNHLKNTLWTVALVYGFFKQAKLSIARKIFRLTLIARRSRHYAGTRYLKRGVNEKGRVANDVETEQIVFEDIDGGIPTDICSVVQNRGSIPLYWSQETSRLNLKPDIILHKKDKDYEATRLHFENLIKRYGNPIIILNLIKSKEKKPRESILRLEFANAIEFINKELPDENNLKFIHWDLHRHSRSRATGVLTFLGEVATYALSLTGFFHCEVAQALESEVASREPAILKENVSALSSKNSNNNIHNTSGAIINGDQEDNIVEDFSQEDNIMGHGSQEDNIVEDGSQEDNMVDSAISEQETDENKDSIVEGGSQEDNMVDSPISEQETDENKDSIAEDGSQEDNMVDSPICEWENAENKDVSQEDNIVGDLSQEDNIVGDGSQEDNIVGDGSQDDIVRDGSQEDIIVDSSISEQETAESKGSNCGICLIKPIRFQKGVLRTNCIDCLDRTNVAQYAYGLAALGHQLHALRLIRAPRIDLDAPLADDLMSFYETMGDTLALQYGGSAAHNKIFSERRGHWKAAVQSQEFFRTLQRHYSNAYMDADKQAAINLFLGHFQPQQGKPAIWELGSDQHYNVGKSGHAFADEDSRSFRKRSLSDGNILRESNPSFSSYLVDQRTSTLSRENHQPEHVKSLSDPIPEISTCKSDVSYSRYTPIVSERQLFSNNEHYFDYEHGSSNFLDLDWLSSPHNSCDKEIYDRLNSPIANLSNETVNGINTEAAPPLRENGSGIKGKQTSEMETFDDAVRASNALSEFSDSFLHWVDCGGTFCH